MKKNVIHALALACCMTAGVAHAEGFYIGGSYGHQRADTQLDTKHAITSPQMGLDLYGGYRFNPYFGVELGVTALGRYEDKTDGKNFKHSNSLAHASLLGYYPATENLDLFGRIGAARYYTKTTGLPDTEKTRLMLGTGLEYKMTEALHLRTEVRYLAKPNSLGLAVGLNYGF